MSVFDTHERLRSRYGTPSPERELVVDDSVEASSFIVESRETSRLIVSAAAREIASAQRPGMFLQGRLVGAGAANRNGAFWTEGDLEFGLPSVEYGPLNWIHQQDEVVGTLVSPWLIGADEADWYGSKYRTNTDQAHIETRAVLWDWAFPERAEQVRRAIESDSLWMSMECIPEFVECLECSSATSFDQYLEGAPGVCEHVRNRTAGRRMVNPTFYGAAIVIPPFEPGWDKADMAEVKNRQYATAMEAATSSSLSEEQAAGMVAAIVKWSNRPR